jgi:phenylpyruvate tautomerase PptA (4-oxalocrotonate tautomerase family)
MEGATFFRGIEKDCLIKNLAKFTHCGIGCGSHLLRGTIRLVNPKKGAHRKMPAITIQSLELTDEQKEILAEKYITIFSELTKVPKDRIYIFFDGYPLDSAGTGGIVFSKRPPKGIIAKFSRRKQREEAEGK